MFHADLQKVISFFHELTHESADFLFQFYPSCHHCQLEKQIILQMAVPNLERDHEKQQVSPGLKASVKDLMIDFLISMAFETLRKK